jgi:ribonuclease P protein component
MLAKKNRLNLALPENSSIFIRGNSKTVFSDFLIAYLRENQSQNLYACLVPKAVFSKASHRNHHRRLLYSFLEKALLNNSFQTKTKADLVIVLKKNFSQNKNQTALEKDFSNLLEKVANV